MTTALWITLAALALLGATFVVRSRLRRNAADERPAPPPVLDPAPAEPLHDEDEVILVPLPTHRGEALVLGSEHTLEAFDRSGLTHRSPRGQRGPLPQVVRQVMSLGGQDATRQAQRDISSGRIVALSEDTMKHLRDGAPVYDKSGQVLALVRGDKGRLRHVMRFDRAGAQAVMASNAATLALTAALSQQLEHIEQQLADIRQTLDGLVADADRARLANAVATNRILETVADSVRRRGEITDADWDLLASVSLPVAANSAEAGAKFAEIAERIRDGMNRSERVEELARLRGQERLEYWLALRTEADLAQTRWDLLQLYWEQTRHPGSAGELADAVWAKVTARQERLATLGQLLQALADPEARTFFDPVRQISRVRLEKQREVVGTLLERHGNAFVPPREDVFAPLRDDGGETKLIQQEASDPIT